MGSLPDFPVSQPLDVQGQLIQFLGQFLFLVHQFLVGVLKFLGNILFLFGCFFERLLGFLDGIFRDVGKLLLHGLVLSQFLFEFLEKLLG